MRRQFSIVLLTTLLALQLLAAQAPNQQGGSTAGQGTHAARQSKPKCTDTGTYVNSKGQTVKRPENCSAAPEGATAQCRDGTYSFSRSRRGSCSHHGGVAKWL
jgi:uncharacterized protein DUF3761